MKFFVLALTGLTAVNGQAVRYDTSTHVKISSTGCSGSSSKTYPTGKTTSASIKVDNIQWSYQVKVPTGYDGNDPKPIIVQHPGWGYNAKQEASGCGIDLYADSKDFISVTVTGGDDNRNRGGPWYSWNAVGTTLSPGPDGPTCTSAGSNQQYCYTSCSAAGKCPSLQCSWTTCLDTGPTASGTGRSPLEGFIPTLYDTLESQLCIDTSREYAAGESNGGMMTYQLGASWSERFAAIAPQFGSFQKGFLMAPSNELPVLDIHGSNDRTVPANTSLSSDGYYYTTTADIFKVWEQANGDTNDCYKQYVTQWDGEKSTYCVQTCSGKTVRCMWNGGHNWFLNSASANGGLVTEFLLQWTKPSHAGFGNSKSPLIADNVTVYSENEVDNWMHEDVENTLSADVPAMNTTTRQPHYGNPNSEFGCRNDEDAIEIGENGVACAPKISSKMEPVECSTDVDCANLDGSYCMNDPTKTKPYYCKGEGLPVPSCDLGNFLVRLSGCPTDAAVSTKSKAWPVCLGQGIESLPYQDGDFHCLLTCPYTAPNKDDHCPDGATCQHGELRHLAHGVCAFEKEE